MKHLKRKICWRNREKQDSSLDTVSKEFPLAKDYDIITQRMCLQKRWKQDLENPPDLDLFSILINIIQT